MVVIKLTNLCVSMSMDAFKYNKHTLSHYHTNCDSSFYVLQG